MVFYEDLIKCRLKLKFATQLKKKNKMKKTFLTANHKALTHFIQPSVASM